MNYVIITFCQLSCIFKKLKNVKSKFSTANWDFKISSRDKQLAETHYNVLLTYNNLTIDPKCHTEIINFKQGTNKNKVMQTYLDACNETQART